MVLINPTKIFYETAAEGYPLYNMLREKFACKEWIAIESHHNIENLRKMDNSAFAQMKRYLIIGTRKTHNYVKNEKVSDYLVPFTSTGCSAMCLYCYLVCNFNKCSYLRLFVNREQMMDKLLKHAKKEGATYEIGSNSDLVLENTVTDNLPWVVEMFAQQKAGKITFPTKFSMVEPLLGLAHKGRAIVRMSVNPQEIIRTVELGTSSLSARIEAINKLCEDGYPVGLLIAPVIMVENWRELYTGLLDILVEKLSAKVKKTMFLEIIFMTYSYVHRMINADAFPNAPNLFDTGKMQGRGRGKYAYRPEIKEEAAAFLRQEIVKRFPKTDILYIV